MKMSTRFSTNKRNVYKKCHMKISKELVSYYDQKRFNGGLEPYEPLCSRCQEQFNSLPNPHHYRLWIRGRIKLKKVTRLSGLIVQIREERVEPVRY